MGILNVIVDLSHHNRVADFNAAKNDGILGVIHKATQGFRYIDPKYDSRRPKPLDAGLMWGAYHFGVGGDGVAQAEHFLSVVDTGQYPQTLLALDVEDNPSGSNMTLMEAEEFVQTVFDKLGRWPVLYSGYYYLRDLVGSYPQTLLANCPLWLARYGPPPLVPTPWSDWTLWQYTDGMAGPEPHEVEGIGHCDRDKFNGDLSALKKLWGCEP